MPPAQAAAHTLVVYLTMATVVQHSVAVLTNTQYDFSCSSSQSRGAGIDHRRATHVRMCKTQEL
jgi:hypothetical protein